MRADLHIHTYYSADGIGVPATVFDTARAAKAHFISIAEHNTVAHIEECLALAAMSRMPRFIPAAEISCTTHLTGTQELHLLCYFVNAGSMAWQTTAFRTLIDSLGEIQGENLSRTAHELGMATADVDEAVEWCRHTGEIHWSVAPSVYYLKRRYAAYGEEQAVSATSALSTARRKLKSSGGIVPYPDVQNLKNLIRHPDCRWFLAHPNRYAWSEGLTIEVLGELVAIGLAGLEVNYLASMEAEPRFAALANRFGLYRSVGTDLHNFDKISTERYGQILDSIDLPVPALNWLS